MHKISRFIIILSAVFLPFFFVSPVLAQVPLNPFEDVCEDAGAGADSSVCQEEGIRDPITGTNGILVTVVRLLSFVVGVASVIMVIVGGLKYIMSNGDSNSISSAKNTILYALIGLAIFAVSQLLVRFVISRL